MKDVLLQRLDLSASERLALTQLLERLKRDHGRTILLVMLYGSIARDEREPDSDVDLLIITRHDDWREHEPIRFLAARLSNEYDVFLSVRVMSLAHLNKLRNLQPLLYQNICQDGIELLRIGDGPDLVKRQPLPASSSGA
jgi:predicted nucleotidyltransferase